jgi:CheY-like chemotaxis protein
VKEQLQILIAERNPAMRELLKREMMAEGYHVLLAKNRHEILECLTIYEPIDLLILDLHLPDAIEVDILEELKNKFPALPVVLHTFLRDHTGHCFASSVITLVGSIVDINKVVSVVLRKCYPLRFESMKKAGPSPAKHSYSSK